MSMKSMAIIFTVVILSLIVNFFQYMQIKHMEERGIRLDKLLDKWQHKVEYYQERLKPHDNL